MIVGILFVSFSTRGHQLVYSYPEVGPDGKYLGFEAAFLADILSPKSALCDKKFQLKINQISFIGHPTLLNVDRPNSGLIYSRKIQNLIVQNKKLSPLTMFHLVFAMSNCVQDEIDLVYDHCLLKITTGFKFEQMKRGYIRSETEKIITIRDEVPKEDANDEILKQSTLAQTLMLVYETMIGKVGATITINHSLRVSIQPNLVTLRALSQSKGANLTNRKYPTMKPYHTLLLLKDPQVIVASMPKDSSPFLITMIESLSPTISFEQLQTTLGCSLGQIFKFAAHLYFWGYAKIVQTIKTRNFYRISQTANFMDIAEIKQDLLIRFPEFDAMSFLRDLSTPKPLHSIISSKESRYTYLEALTYLLGRDFIAQIHMYLGNRFLTKSINCSQINIGKGVARSRKRHSSSDTRAIESQAL
jgi:hypothetical protein